MNENRPAHLPDYASDSTKAALLAAGASGTIYSLVMPESEAALAFVVDGGERAALRSEKEIEAARKTHYLSRYHEPWTQKQDAMHEEYFVRWRDWAAPIVGTSPGAFSFTYPTAGASEGIFKLMAEHLAACGAADVEPNVHIFEGEYEGFPAYADALKIRTVRHDRSEWRAVAGTVDAGAMFWISQPSAIDGAVWEDFGAFLAAMAEARPHVPVVPDLTYVGSVAYPFPIDLDLPNVPAFVFSHSKPFGGYYHRVGGVFARRECPSLFGNKWFKNLQSLAWATEMMKRHDVFSLPRRYRAIQQQAAERVAALLGIAGLEPADVLLLATAPASAATSEPLRAVLRGSPRERVVRLCLTPAMTCLIDPEMAPGTAPALQAAWTAGGNA
jgi:hypothetical protein